MRAVQWIALSGVELHVYQHRDWHELVELWLAFNKQLLAVAEAAPEAAWSRTCLVAGSEPLTLRFVLDAYVSHMKGHLRHMGMDVEGDLSAQE